jgi:hypothetical protein
MNNLTCIDCRHAIPKILKIAQIVGCPHCGSILTMGENGALSKHKKLTPLAELRAHKGYEMFSNGKGKPFYVGKSIRYDGKLYLIYAIYVYAINYEEYEEEGNSWQQASGFITEWYAENAEKKRIVLMRDTDSKFYVLNQAAKNWLNDYQIRDFNEFGTYQLVSFVGADEGVLDETGHYRIVYKDYLTESQDINFPQKTSPLFEIEAITPTQLKRMQLIEDTAKMKAEDDYINVSFYRNLFAAALVILLLLMAFTESTNIEGVGNYQTVNFEYATLGNGALDSLSLSPKSAGVFDLKAGKNYLFRANAYLYGYNKDVDYSVSIIKKDEGKAISDVSITFFTESGTDDEGSWTEDLLQDEFKFQVAETGQYEVFVAPDYDNLTNMPHSNLTISITTTGYYYFYLIAGGALFLAFLICQWQREHLAAFANLPSGTFLHDVLKQ